MKGGPGNNAQSVSFSDWANKWYIAYETQVEASTYSSYRYTIALLVKYFGETPIAEIKSMEINGFMNWLLKQGYSQSQLTKCRSMLIQLYDAAEANDLVIKNYARKSFKNSKAKKDASIAKKKDAYTAEEFHLLMDNLNHDLLGYSIRLMLVSGIRVQELLALTPRDIAEDGSTLSISKAVKTVDGMPELGKPKSLKSTRIVPIAPKYREITLWLREHGALIYLWMSNRENLVYSVGTFRRKYYRAIKAIPDVRVLSPHCCRHTYVTLMESQGIALELIAGLVGHSDIKTTLDYLHIRPETLANAALSIEKI